DGRRTGHGPVAAETLREIVVAGDNREQILLSEEERRQQELCPDAEGDDESNSQKPGPGKRHLDSRENLPFASAVNPRRVFEIARQLQHEGAKQEYGKGCVDRDVDQD